MANIIVTGASKGIGFETVLELALRPGHSILAISRSEIGLSELRKIAFQLNPDAQLKTLCFDLTGSSDLSEIHALVQSFLQGNVDILINNAGSLVNKPFLETPLEDFRSLLEINFLSPVQLIQSLVPYMHSQLAHIVNIGSMGGFQGSVKFPGLSAYSSSKGALHILTECLAVELMDLKIKVNGLAIGSVQTEMLEAAFPEYQAPVMAYEMGAYIAQFALTGHTFFNGKILPVSVSTP